MRSASAVVATWASGFHVFRIDGYSHTKTLPGGERISSEVFTVGGRRWRVDFYPNGADASKDSSDSISLHLVLTGCRRGSRGMRVRAQYKFSVLDSAAGVAMHKRPTESGVFTYPCDNDEAADEPNCGYAEFMSRAALERLVKDDDCLAIRCDIGVTAVRTESLGGRSSGRYDRDESSSDSDSDSEPRRWDRNRKRSSGETDDKEYVRQCLAQRLRRD